MTGVQTCALPIYGQPGKHHRPRAAIVPDPESLGQQPETQGKERRAHDLRDSIQRQKQPHPDIDMQESEQENNGTWEFHWKKVGAKDGTRKTCGNLRSTIPRPRHEETDERNRRRERHDGYCRDADPGLVDLR